jgi:hypothetical protein
MRFGTRNVRALYRTSSLKTVASELTKYNLDLVTIQQLRWVEGGTQPAPDYTFFYGNGKCNHHLEISFSSYQ